MLLITMQVLSQHRGDGLQERHQDQEREQDGNHNREADVVAQPDASKSKESWVTVSGGSGEEGHSVGTEAPTHGGGVTGRRA